MSLDTVARHCVAAAALVVGACVGEPPRGELAAATASPPPLVAVPPPAPAVTAAGDDEAWRRLAQSLEQENTELRRERDHWQAETGRYQQGLERAVAELNRVAGAAAAQRLQVQSQPQARPGERAMVSTLGAPQVQIIGDDVLVTATVWNSSDTDARGRAHVELLLDGGVVDSTIVALDVPARTDHALTARMRHQNRSGTYSARVRLEY